MPLPVILTEREYKELLREFGVEGLGVHTVTHTDPSDMELQSALWYMRGKEEKAVAEEKERKEKLEMLKTICDITVQQFESTK